MADPNQFPFARLAELTEQVEAIEDTAAAVPTIQTQITTILDTLVSLDDRLTALEP